MPIRRRNSHEIHRDKCEAGSSSNRFAAGPSPNAIALIFEDCGGDSDDLFEFKCSGSELINCRFVRCKGGVRIRHGVGTRVINCAGLTRVKVRCGPHLIANCAQADVVAYAGNLPGKDGEWQSLHDHGGGHNMQCAYHAQVANVKSVQLGYYFGDNDKKYPATECNIAPGVPTKVILALPCHMLG
jgi:hypothetical protein